MLLAAILQAQGDKIFALLPVHMKSLAVKLSAGTVLLLAFSLPVMYLLAFSQEKSRNSVFRISGLDKDYGSYHGILQLKSCSGSNLDLIRLVEYDHFKFDGLSVQEVWTGKGNLDESGQLQAEFRLRKADLFSQVDSKFHSKDEFKETLNLHYAISELKNGAESVIISPRKAKDRLISDRLASRRSLWESKRQVLSGKGDCFQLIGNWANLTLFLPAASLLRFDSLLTPYTGKEEFRSGNQYFVTDKSDFGFYQKNKEKIRLPNKVLDHISLVESRLCHDAYAYSLAEKAKYFDQEMSANHLNRLGLYVRARFDSSQERKEFIESGDGALWSGMYAASQAMRHLCTKDEEALSNFKRVSEGLMLLMDLPEAKSEFARTAELLEPGKTAADPWVEINYAGKRIKYLRGGNNDMLKGLFLSFAFAFEILPDKDPLLERVKAHALRLCQLRIVREKLHPGNEFSALGLTALASGREGDLRAYLRNYKERVKAIGFFNLDKGFYYGGIADWSGVNLSMCGQLADIIIAKNLCRLAAKTNKVELQAGLEEVLAALRQKLADSWTLYFPAKRDFITIAAAAFAENASGSLNFPDSCRQPNFVRKAAWPEDKKESIWLLHEMPMLAKGFGYRLAFDYRLRPQWCMSAWPLRPWKLFVNKYPAEYYLQGAYSYPLFEGLAFQADNSLVSAFAIKGEADCRVRPGRFDYLFLYWAARLAGLIDGNT